MYRDHLTSHHLHRQYHRYLHRVFWIGDHQSKTDNQIVFYHRGAIVVSIEAVVNDHRHPFRNYNLVLVLCLFYADIEIREVIHRSYGDALNSAKFVGFGVAAIVVVAVDGVVVAVTDCILIVLNLNLLLLLQLRLFKFFFFWDEIKGKKTVKEQWIIELNETMNLNE